MFYDLSIPAEGWLVTAILQLSIYLGVSSKPQTSTFSIRSPKPLCPLGLHHTKCYHHYLRREVETSCEV